MSVSSSSTSTGAAAVSPTEPYIDNRVDIFQDIFVDPSCSFHDYKYEDEKKKINDLYLKNMEKIIKNDIFIDKETHKINGDELIKKINSRSDINNEKKRIIFHIEKIMDLMNDDIIYIDFHNKTIEKLFNKYIKKLFKFLEKDKKTLLHATQNTVEYLTKFFETLKTNETPDKVLKKYIMYIFYYKQEIPTSDFFHKIETVLHDNIKRHKDSTDITEIVTNINNKPTIKNSIFPYFKNTSNPSYINAITSMIFQIPEFYKLLIKFENDDLYGKPDKYVVEIDTAKYETENDNKTISSNVETLANDRYNAFKQIISQINFYYTKDYTYNMGCENTLSKFLYFLNKIQKKENVNFTNFKDFYMSKKSADEAFTNIIQGLIPICSDKYLRDKIYLDTTIEYDYHISSFLGRKLVKKEIICQECKTNTVMELLDETHEYITNVNPLNATEIEDYLNNNNTQNYMICETCFSNKKNNLIKFINMNPIDKLNKLNILKNSSYKTDYTNIINNAKHLFSYTETDFNNEFSSCFNTDSKDDIVLIYDLKIDVIQRFEKITEELLNKKFADISSQIKGDKDGVLYFLLLHIYLIETIPTIKYTQVINDAIKDEVSFFSTLNTTNYTYEYKKNIILQRDNICDEKGNITNSGLLDKILYLSGSNYYLKSYIVCKKDGSGGNYYFCSIQYDNLYTTYETYKYDDKEAETEPDNRENGSYFHYVMT